MDEEDEGVEEAEDERRALRSSSEYLFSCSFTVFCTNIGFSYDRET